MDRAAEHPEQPDPPPPTDASRRSFFGSMGAFALLLSACGGSDDSPAPAPWPRPRPPAPPHTGTHAYTRTGTRACTRAGTHACTRASTARPALVRRHRHLRQSRPRADDPGRRRRLDRPHDVQHSGHRRPQSHDHSDARAIGADQEPDVGHGQLVCRQVEYLCHPFPRGDGELRLAVSLADGCRRRGVSSGRGVATNDGGDRQARLISVRWLRNSSCRDTSYIASRPRRGRLLPLDHRRLVQSASRRPAMVDRCADGNSRSADAAAPCPLR